eukprot:2171259-Rhodomonas_salina.4
MCIRDRLRLDVTERVADQDRDRQSVLVHGRAADAILHLLRQGRSRRMRAWVCVRDSRGAADDQCQCRRPPDVVPALRKHREQQYLVPVHRQDR